MVIGSSVEPREVFYKLEAEKVATSIEDLEELLSDVADVEAGQQVKREFSAKSWQPWVLQQCLKSSPDHTNEGEQQPLASSRKL